MVQPKATLRNGADANKLLDEDRAAHRWYRFVLSFPPHLVRDYIERFTLDSGDRVLDPFCGTGTTLVECKKLGITSAGVEANPAAHFATAVKTDWSPDPDGLRKHSRLVRDEALEVLEATGVDDNPALEMALPPSVTLRTLPPEANALLLKNSISPLPLHKILILLECIERLRDDRYYSHQRLALANAVVFSVSNLHFGPEVGVTTPKSDAPVVATWMREVEAVANDLRQLHPLNGTPACAYYADARHLLAVLEPESISAVITSPPYPNEKDYTRTTRLESVLLGFLKSRQDLKALKRTLLRSNTRGVYKGDDDDQWITEHPEIHRIADAIEKRRVALGKTSGFERLYPKVTRLYFGGMWRHFADLKKVLRPGAMLAYVVGDQASYLQVMIRTGNVLADIARSLGYDVLGLDLFRTRLATATREQLREEVLLLRWPG